MQTDTTTAERSVIGAALISRKAVEATESLRPTDFHDPRLELVWEAVQGLYADNAPVDVLTVSDRLGENIGRAGGVVSLHELAGEVPTAANAGYYAGIVRDAAVKRRIGEAGDRIRALASEPGEPSDLVEAAHQALDGLMEMRGHVRWVRDVLPDALAALESKTSFVPSPWRNLNRAIGGFRPGAVYVVAARPGVGKTVIAAQIAAGLADHGMVAFSSLEMSEVELVHRLMSERLEIMVGHLKEARLTEKDRQRIIERRQVMENLNIAIDDRTEVAPQQIREFARAVSRQGKLAGIVVDYMQLMTSRSNADRHVQVSEFSRQLKIMAKTFRVPVIALSQLNRNLEQRQGGTPKLSDLRESGSIEQDADVVMLLRREGQYPSEHLIIDVAKNRHGDVGEVDLAWQGEFSRAIEFDNRPPDPSTVNWGA